MITRLLCGGGRAVMLPSRNIAPPTPDRWGHRCPAAHPIFDESCGTLLRMTSTAAAPSVLSVCVPAELQQKNQTQDTQGGSTRGTCS